MKYKRPESILLIVYSCESQVLMLRRKEPNDFWQSVTGSLEWDEKPHTTVRRELQEETGLTTYDSIVDCKQSNIFDIYDMWRNKYAPGTTQNQEHVFRLYVPTQEEITIDEREHAEYQWMDRVKAAKIATSHTNRQAIFQWVPTLQN